MGLSNRSVRGLHLFIFVLLIFYGFSFEWIPPVQGASDNRSDNNYKINPSVLKAYQDIHPRLYIDAQRIQELRQYITTTHAALWVKLRDKADDILKKNPPAYHLGSDEEELWERIVGSDMVNLAMAYQLSGAPKYLAGAKKWALTSCSYSSWGRNQYAGTDLAAAHQLFGLGLVYDWCYHDLDQSTLATIRHTLIQRGTVMYQAALPSGKAYWKDNLLQNHMWVDLCGLTSAGLAVYDEDPEAINWLNLTVDKFGKTMQALPDDGATHEGVGYWGYGLEYMLRFMDMSRKNLGVDMYDSTWLKNTAYYRLYLSLPRNSWSKDQDIVNFADAIRVDWAAHDFVLRALAKEYQNGYAQWLGQEIDTAGYEKVESPWLNLVWYEPAVPVKPPSALPTFHFFDDLGVVAARSDWSGDESLVAFRCGPYMGNKDMNLFTKDINGGHVHPDANHFVLFGEGEWLIRDDGYAQKFTSNHNTLLIDGKGQLGECAMWFKGAEVLKVKARPVIRKVFSSPEVDLISGDAAEAYPRDTGLKRFVRNLIFIKPDVLIVVDDIQLANPHSLELRFFPEAQKIVLQSDGGYLAYGNKSLLRFQPLTPENAVTKAEDVPVVDRAGVWSNQMAFRIQNANQTRWQNVVAFTWSNRQTTPSKVILQKQDADWQFQVGNRTFIFNSATGSMNFEENHSKLNKP